MVFEFDSCIERVKRTLLGANYASHESNGTLKKDSFQKLCEEVIKCLNACPEDYERRNIYLFILLNGNADFVDTVAEDQDFAHLIDTIPRLSQKLTLRLILNAEGLFFLRELIAFAPSAVSISVMETIFSTDELHPSSCQGIFASELSKACFYKLTNSRNECWVVLQKFVGFFNALQADLLSEKIDICDSLLHNLEICLFIFQCNIKDIGKCWPGYSLNCTNNFENSASDKIIFRTIPEITMECTKISLLNIKQLVQEITLDDWLTWAERDFNHSETYQQHIGNLAWKLKVKLEENAEKAEYCNLPVRYLADVLSNFSILKKDDEDKNAGIEEIKTKLLEKHTNNEKWMKAFLQHSDIMYDQETVTIIKTNFALLDKEDVEFLLEKFVSKVKDENTNPTDRETFRCLSYLIMKNLSLENMMTLYRNHIDKYGASSDLCDSEFTARLQTVFNKTCFDSEECNIEWQHEIYRLSVLNPTAVIQKSLGIGVLNVDAVKSMASMLQMLKPLSKEHVSEWLSEIHLKCPFQKSEMKLFPKFASELVIHEVLGINEMFKHIICGIEQAIQCEDWSVTCMWIMTMRETLKRLKCYNNEGGSMAELILFLGQLLELCEQSIAEFLYNVVLTRSEVLLILKDLMRFELPESDKNSLHLCSEKFSVMSKCHLEPFCANEHYTQETAVYDLIFNSKVAKPENAAYVLAELIPFVTHGECRDLGTVLKQQFGNHDDSAYSVFQSFSAAITLLVAACSDVDFDVSPKHVACLNYCVTCLGDILRNITEPTMATSNYLCVLDETFYLLSKMPSQVWNRSVMDLLPLLVSLMKQVAPDEDALRSLSYILSACPASEGRALLENQMKSLFQDDATVETREEDVSDR